MLPNNNRYRPLRVVDPKPPVTASPDTSGLPAVLREELLRLWADFTTAADETALTAATDPAVSAHLPRVWACSPFVARTIIRRPALLSTLAGDGALEGARSARDYRALVGAALAEVEDESTLLRTLRHLRQQEMTRIAWRDIAGTAGLQATMRELSDLADAVLDGALGWLHDDLCRSHGTPVSQSGEPQRLVVLAMGKLGAHELNFSSDIDLIFAFPERGETQGGGRVVANEQFFDRLSRRLIKALGDVTEDGFVFRVDMRLRPFGESGPLVMSIPAMEDYYEAHARDWERYAMIKARVAAGDQTAGARLTEMLTPFVYRRYLDYGAFEALRDMKALISDEVRSRGLQDNIKLGAGGIREIEFIGQTFQLIRGGREPPLRARPIQTILRRLEELGYLPDYAVRNLAAAYEFLRNTEHRIQEIDDQQTQTLPASEIDRARVACGMGFTDWGSFVQALTRHRANVAEHFEQVLAAPQGEAPAAQSDEEALLALWRGGLGEDQARATLEAAGFADPAEALAAVEALRSSARVRSLSRQGRERLDRLMPMLLAAAARAQPGTLPRLLVLVETIAQRSVYLTLLAENPLGLSQLVRLFAASPWIADQIVRQPILLDELLDPRTLYRPPGPGELEEEMYTALSQLPSEELEHKMEALRQFKHTQVLRVAAADITGSVPVKEVSNHLSAIAETLVRAALMLTWDELVGRHGEPRCVDGGGERTAGIAIIAYGKLGGFELGYSSDVDLVFLHDSRGEQQMTSGARPIDNNVFFARLTQRLIHVLTTMTPAGRVYEIDTRLRPSGASGLLVSSVDAYADYQRKAAWTWEHQALVRARPVAGDPSTCRAFQAIRAEILARERDPASLRRDIVEMREKMRRELGERDPALFDLKQGRGGMTDIEFMVQYTVLRWAATHPELLERTDNLRLLDTFAASALLSKEACDTLREAYFAIRAAVHRLALQERRAVAGDDEFAAERAGVIDIWDRLLGDDAD